jgi:membrane-associated phospholipid phosphatase
MKQYKEQDLLGIVPRYAALSLVFALVWNSVIYNGAIALVDPSRAIDMTTVWDTQIPFQPGWIVIYFGCFIFWGLNYLLIARQGQEIWFRFLTADLLGELICGLCFFLLPTTNVRPAVTGTDLASLLVVFLYRIDPAQNLFPSIHCMVSWFCYLGLREQERIPLWYRQFSGIFALAVCASTLFLKQHCLPDVLAGVLVAQACYLFAQHSNSYLLLQRIFTPKERREAT